MSCTVCFQPMQELFAYTNRNTQAIEWTDCAADTYPYPYTYTRWWVCYTCQLVYNPSRPSHGLYHPGWWEREKSKIGELLEECDVAL